MLTLGDVPGTRKETEKMPASIADVKAAVRAILAYKFDGEGSREVEGYAKSDPQLYAALKVTYEWLRQSE